MTSPEISFDRVTATDAVAGIRAASDFGDDGLGAAVAAAAAAPTKARRTSPALERVLTEVHRQDAAVADAATGIRRGAAELDRFVETESAIDHGAAAAVQAQSGTDPAPTGGGGSSW